MARPRTRWKKLSGVTPLTVIRQLRGGRCQAGASCKATSCVSPRVARRHREGRRSPTPYPAEPAIYARVRPPPMIEVSTRPLSQRASRQEIQAREELDL